MSSLPLPRTLSRKDILSRWLGRGKGVHTGLMKDVHTGLMKDLHVCGALRKSEASSHLATCAWCEDIYVPSPVSPSMAATLTFPIFSHSRSSLSVK